MLIFNMSFPYFVTKINAFCPQIFDFKNLDDSVVIFQALQTYAASLNSAASVVSLASTVTTALFLKKTSLS